MIFRILLLCAGYLVVAGAAIANDAPHIHGTRSHSHPLPVSLGYAHKHGAQNPLGEPVDGIYSDQNSLGPVLPEPGDAVKSHYARMPAAQKAKIQEALVWNSEPAALLDKPFGPASYPVIRSWQRQQGFAADGKLTGAQISQLLSMASAAKRTFHWTTMRSPRGDYQIGVPRRLASIQSVNETGGVEFHSPDQDYMLSILNADNGRVTTDLDDLFQEMLLQFRSQGMGNIRQNRSQEGFSLSATQLGEILYARFVESNGKQIGYMLGLPYTASTRSISDRLIAATALSFKLVGGAGGASVQEGYSRPKPVADLLDHRKVQPLVRRRGSQKFNAEEIFRRVSPSVWMLASTSNSSVSQGSAVAIHPNYLLTNCHVLKSASRGLILNSKVQKEPLEVSVYTRDRAGDRCVLYSKTPLPSFVGVRPYDDMNTGEKVFTIGAPRGLSLTIAEGLLSSKRDDKKTRYLQTSAPISQGSSGGGLFDSHGNLLGITTLMIQRGQNLNFAVPAQDYWLDL